MQKSHFLFLMLLATSCQVTETVNINNDGTGSIEIDQLRDENFFSKYDGMNPLILKEKEEKFEDSTYIFRDFIAKNQKNFNKFQKKDQDLLSTFSNVTIHIKADNYNMVNFKNANLDFEKIENIPDLYKIFQYKEKLENNFVLTSSDYYAIKYSFDGNVFKRIVTITDQEKASDKVLFKQQKMKLLKGFNPIQSLILKYSFPKKIKSVSNSLTKISEDKKSMSIEFSLFDFYENPEITNLEVVLE